MYQEIIDWLYDKGDDIEELSKVCSRYYFTSDKYEYTICVTRKYNTLSCTASKEYIITYRAVGEEMVYLFTDAPTEVKDDLKSAIINETLTTIII